MIRVHPISNLSLRCSDEPWRFAAEHRGEIDQHWAEVTAMKPDLWNGDVLLCTKAEVKGGKLAATFAKADYASFVAWRDWGRPDVKAWSCFGVPAVFSSDGALLVGVMSPWTLNAGKAYPPSGSLEPRDVLSDGSVDLMGSMVTELREETGLDLAHAEAGEMVAIFEGQRIAVTRRHDFPLPFEDIEQRFTRHNAAESKPELARIEGVRSASQIDSRMPPYAQEIIRYFMR